jgi:cell division protein ZapE
MGLYLCGPVGRGKSMLMDLFFAAVPGRHKRRSHFHAFMLDVHERVERERRARSREPIAKVAADIAAEATLLCLDELQVDDISTMAAIIAWPGSSANRCITRHWIKGHTGDCRRLSTN